MRWLEPAWKWLGSGHEEESTRIWKRAGGWSLAAMWRVVVNSKKRVGRMDQMSPSIIIKHRSIAQVSKSGLHFKTIMHRLKGLFCSICAYRNTLRPAVGFWLHFDVSTKLVLREHAYVYAAIALVAGLESV